MSLGRDELLFSPSIFQNKKFKRINIPNQYGHISINIQLVIFIGLISIQAISSKYSEQILREKIKTSDTPCLQSRAYS